MTDRTEHPPPSGGLTLEAMELMRTLAPEIYPNASIERLPRIINQLALHWRHPDECRRYFDELLNDERGDRQGFPFEIVVELTNLKQEHARQYPTAMDVFDMQFDMYGKRL